MNSALFSLLFSLVAALAAQTRENAPPAEDSTSLVREAPGAVSSPRPKPSSGVKRASLDPEVEVPQVTGSGVLIRKLTPTTPNADAGLPRLRTAVLGEAVPPVAEGAGSAGSIRMIAPGQARMPADGASQDRAIAEANRRIASAEENLRRHFPDFDAGLRDLNEAVALIPKHPRAHALIAALYNRKGDYGKAEDSAMASLHLYSKKNPAAYSNLAFAQLLQGRAQDAEKNSALAVSQDENGALARYVHALCLEGTDRRGEALAELKAAAALDPARFSARYDAARRGGRIFNREGGDSAYLSGASGPPPAAARFPWKLAWVFAAILALGLAAGRRWSQAKPAAWRPPVPPPPADGFLAGKYEMTSVLGRGGWGDVYEAFDRTLQRPVAIKKMSDDLAAVSESKARSNLLREAKIVSSLHHPAIVDIYEIFERGFDIYLVFELVKGKTLERILAENKRLNLAHALDILRPVCHALAFAHDHGVVHRDLKPSNIMVTQQGNVKVMDFGIARSVMDKTTDPGRPVGLSAQGQTPHSTSGVGGTPMYRAPEMEQGVVSKEGDVFALGCCLYEILSGRPPFPAGTGVAEKMAMKFAPLSSLMQGAPPGLDVLVREALEPRMERRIKGPAEFLARLEKLAAPPSAGGR